VNLTDICQRRASIRSNNERQSTIATQKIVNVSSSTFVNSEDVRNTLSNYNIESELVANFGVDGRVIS